MTRRLDRVFRPLEDRTKQMLWEDFVGFGVMRSAINLLRGVIYGTGGLAIPAALERLGSEAGSLFTDNILPGLVALGIGKHLDAKKGGYSNGWTDFKTIELFQEVARRSPGERAFLENLAEKLAGEPDPARKQACLKALKTVWKQPGPAKGAKNEFYTRTAAQIAQDLGMESFDRKIGGHCFRLDNLLEDVGLLRDRMAEIPDAQVDSGWQRVVEGTLHKTRKIKNMKLLPAIAIGMAATYSFPPLLAWVSKQFFGMKYYPGDIGLKGQIPSEKPAQPTPIPAIFANNQVFRNLHEKQVAQPEPKNLRYVREQLSQGKIGPLLLALSPLPFALGLFDTVRLKWRNPFKFGAFLRNLQQDYDFSKAKPFTTQPQMASMFALLITSRLMTARSDNEFRERLVDSGLGWVVWILATPFFKKHIASHFDKTRETMLLKEVAGRKLLRTRAEIEHLLPVRAGAEVARKTLAHHIWINAGSTVLTMILLGIIEPVLGILWSRHNSRKKEASMQQAVPQQDFAPQPTAIPQNYFRA
jgi:hypothetical protein